MLFTLCLANCQQNPQNIYYPYHRVISNADMLKKAVRYDHVGASFKDGCRSLKNFQWSDVSILDCDNDHSEDPSQQVTPQDLNYVLPGVMYAAVPSRHDQMVKGNKTARSRFHVLFPHRRFNSPEEEAELKRKIQERFPFFDANAVDGARFFFGNAPTYVIWHPGTMTIDEYLEKYRNPIIDAMETPEAPLLLPAAETPAAMAPPVPFGAIPSQEVVHVKKISTANIIPEGTRNSTLSKRAAQLVKRYGVTETAKEKFLEVAQRCTPPLPPKELASIWKSAEKFGYRVMREEGYVPPEMYGEKLPALALRPGDNSDMGEAKVLAKEYKTVLAYTASTHFMVYNGTYWQESKELAMGVCQTLLDRQLEEAKSVSAQAEKTLNSLGISPKDKKKGKNAPAAGRAWQTLWEEAKDYETFLIQQRDSRNIDGTLKMVRPMVLMDIEDFDSREFLLNTPDGTYDLRKGMEGFQPHRSEDHLTKVTAVSPADTEEALWYQCLQVFFSGDEALICYVQQIVGLSAIGKVYQESFIMAYGEGSNGKSTFWNAISRVLGTYSGSLSSDVLTTSCRRNVKPEMAELKGKRLVIASELEEGTRLNTAFMKQLCSTDMISAEKKYKDPFHFTPTHTLVLCTNHLPKVGANDKGTWRRLIVIPFEAKLEGKQDVKNYADYLVEKAGGAILKWIIEGAKQVIDAKFQIPIPPVVAQAVENYRDSNDWLRRFLDERCDEDASYAVTSGELYDAYQAYCIHHSEYTRNRTDFAQALSMAGFKRNRDRNTRYVEGLKVKAMYSGISSQ